MTGREGPGPERPGPDYPPEWDAEPAEDAPCGLCGLVPAEGEQHRAVFAVGNTGEDAEEVCLGPDRRQLDYAPVPDTEPAEDPEPSCGQQEGPHFTDCYADTVTPDPWTVQGPTPPPPF